MANGKVAECPQCGGTVFVNDANALECKDCSLLGLTGLANTEIAAWRAWAASPDLLAACKKLRQQLKDLLSSIQDQGIEDRFRDENINMISESITAVELADDAIAKAEGK